MTKINALVQEKFEDPMRAFNKRIKPYKMIVKIVGAIVFTGFHARSYFGF